MMAELDEAIPIGWGQTISQPAVVAFMLELLDPQPGQNILDVGYGSGWTTALLACIVSEKGARGMVTGIERIRELADFGRKNVARYGFIDNGAAACYIQGALADDMVAAGRFDEMAEALDLIRKNGLPAGIGGHKLATLKGAVENGLRPDFWMKTLHQVNYWSARPGEKECDNIWCDDPAAAVAYMNELQEPWIAFKVLAAGAIPRSPR